MLSFNCRLNAFSFVGSEYELSLFEEEEEDEEEECDDEYEDDEDEDDEGDHVSSSATEDGKVRDFCNAIWKREGSKGCVSTSAESTSNIISNNF